MYRLSQGSDDRCIHYIYIYNYNTLQYRDYFHLVLLYCLVQISGSLFIRLTNQNHIIS